MPKILDKLISRCSNIDPKLYESATRSLPIIEVRRLRNFGANRSLGNLVKYTIKGYKYELNYDLFASFVQEFIQALSHNSVSTRDLCYMEFENSFPVEEPLMSIIARSFSRYYNRHRHFYFDSFGGDDFGGSFGDGFDGGSGDGDWGDDFGGDDFGGDDFGGDDFGGDDFGGGDFGEDDFDFEGSSFGVEDLDEGNSDETYFEEDVSDDADFYEEEFDGSEEEEEYEDENSNDDEQDVETTPSPGSNSYHYTYIYPGPWPWLWRPWGLFYHTLLPAMRRGDRSIYAPKYAYSKANSIIKVELLDVKSVRNHICLCYLVTVETEITSKQRYSGYFSRKRGIYARSFTSKFIQSKYGLELEFIL